MYTPLDQPGLVDQRLCLLFARYVALKYAVAGFVIGLAAGAAITKLIIGR